MIHEFTYHGKIVAYKRARASFKSRRVYNDKKYTDFKHLLAGCAQKFVKEPFPAHTPVSLHLVFGMGPKAKSTKLEFFTKVPDIDNLAKSVMDAFNKVVYTDDACVVELYVTKIYSEKPYIRITAGEFEEL